MRLTELLASLSEDKMRWLARELEADDSHSSAALTASRIESIIRSPRHIELAIGARRPPILPVLRELLARESHRCDVDELRDLTSKASTELESKIVSGRLLGSDDHALYRRVLAEAWRSDLRLDVSELSLLGVLRKELEMTQADHFLTAHHPDVEPFWRTEDPFGTVILELERHGVLFRVGDDVVLPHDLVRWVRDAIGIHIEPDAYRRFLNQLHTSVLMDVLKGLWLKSSGSKEQRIERIIEHFVPPRDVLDGVHISDLKNLASHVGAKKSGSKEDVIDRLIDHFRRGLDLESAKEEPESEPEVEPKDLSHESFAALFSTLKGKELAFILYKADLKGSGSKSARVEALWKSHLNETSLLSLLGNEGIGRVLERSALKSSGSKQTKIERLLDFFRNEKLDQGRTELSESPETEDEVERPGALE